MGKESVYKQLHVPQLNISTPQRLLPLDLPEHEVDGGGFRVRPSESNIFYNNSMSLTPFGSSMQLISLIRDEGHSDKSGGDFRAQHDLGVTRVTAQVFGYSTDPDTIRFLANSYNKAIKSRSAKVGEFYSDTNRIEDVYQQQDIIFSS